MSGGARLGANASLLYQLIVVLAFLTGIIPYVAYRQCGTHGPRPAWLLESDLATEHLTRPARKRERGLTEAELQAITQALRKFAQ